MAQRDGSLAPAGTTTRGVFGRFRERRSGVAVVRTLSGQIRGFCTVVLASIALEGCDPYPGGPCTEGEDIGRSTYAANSSLSDANGEIGVQIRWPIRDPGDEQWPVAVVVPGGFVPDEVATRKTSVGVQNEDGIVSIQVDLAGENWFEGANDLRGPIGRKAVALALRYAAGEIADQHDCKITDRSRAALAENVVLVGLSNGGNLAAATLADASLDLPPVIGWVAWETPAGPQFVNSDHRNDDRLYTPGTCVADASGIVCPYDVTTLAAALSGYCFDLNGNGRCNEDDLSTSGPLDVETGREWISPQIATLAQNAGLSSSSVADLASSTTFWAERNASLLAPDVVAQYPDLPILLVASEEDHVLTGLSDHPHVFGLGEVLQTAGARWTRLNPGRDWSELEDENPPNAPLTISAASGWLTPKDGPALESNLSAAVREISDRTNDDSW